MVHGIVSCSYAEPGPCQSASSRMAQCETRQERWFHSGEDRRDDGWATDIIDADGFAAEALGVPRTANTYPPGSSARAAWYRGWNTNEEASRFEGPSS
jgi:hypothetical protein